MLADRQWLLPAADDVDPVRLLGLYILHAEHAHGCTHAGTLRKVPVSFAPIEGLAEAMERAVRKADATENGYAWRGMSLREQAAATLAELEPGPGGIGAVQVLSSLLRAALELQREPCRHIGIGKPGCITCDPNVRDVLAR